MPKTTSAPSQLLTHCFDLARAHVRLGMAPCSYTRKSNTSIIYEAPPFTDGVLRCPSALERNVGCLTVGVTQEQVHDLTFTFPVKPGHACCYDASRIPLSLIRVPLCLEMRETEFAGRGVFARKRIAKNTFLGWYDGMLVRSDFAIDLHPYAMGRIDYKTDVVLGSPFHWPSYINDNHGSVASPNVKYCTEPRFDVARRPTIWLAVYTSRDVFPGEQLLVSYGAGYWKMHDLRERFFARFRELASEPGPRDDGLVHAKLSAEFGGENFDIRLWEPLLSACKPAIPSVSEESCTV